MWETYHSPSSLEEAIRLLNEHALTTRIIAGGTDLLLELERGTRKGIDRLIDISRIPGLDQIRVDGDWIRMGPLVTHNDCAGSDTIRKYATALAQACWEVGAPQIRNRGTVAGNLITASPANDSIPPLLALDAQVILGSAKEERTVRLSEFYEGVRKTIMAPEEILTGIRFPIGDETRRSAFFKLGLRRAQAISVVNAAVVLDFVAEKITHASIALGSVAPLVVHAGDAENYLIGKALDEDTIEQAATLAVKAASPIDDLRGSAVYRNQMVKVCVLRALRDLHLEQEHARIPTTPVMLWGDRPEAKDDLPDFAHDKSVAIETTINGKRMQFESGQDKTLLRLLREEAGLIGTKEGCAEGECGACTVFLDAEAVMACLVPAPRAHGAEITTVEGIAEGETLHPVQQAFIDEGAVQCGYCTPGFIMSGVKLLEEKPKPLMDDIKQALTGNLCRCTGYYKILTAMEKAAKM